MTPALRSLRYKNYQIYSAGQLISNIGTWAQGIAQGWLIYRLTHSSALLGLVTFAEHFPAFVLAPLAGVMCDHRSLRRILGAAQSLMVLQAAVLAALTLTGYIQVWHVFCLALLMGILNAFDIPARQTFVVELVDPIDLPNAIALNTSLYNLARIIGPALAGVLIASFGEGWCFSLNALSFLPGLAGLAAIRTAGIAREKKQIRFTSQFREGLRYIRQHHVIRQSVFLLYSMCFMGFSYLVLMPVFVTTVFHGDSRSLGALTSIVGIGAVLGALFLAFQNKQVGLERIILIASGCFSGLILAFSLTHTQGVALPLLLITGFFMAMNMASIATLVQTQVSSPMRGRVMSVYSMAFTGLSPVGALIAGYLADHIGAPATVFLSGLICLGATFWYAQQKHRVVVPATTAYPSPLVSTDRISLEKAVTPLEKRPQPSVASRL